jgi:hypothetical protein
MSRLEERGGPFEFKRGQRLSTSKFDPRNGLFLGFKGALLEISSCLSIVTIRILESSLNYHPKLLRHLV